MHYLEATLPTVEENLALDEALLRTAEDGEGSEVLRIWEIGQPAVIVGRGSRVWQEVDVAACRRAGVPIRRRCSGGCAVVIGPGCLVYSLVLRGNPLSLPRAVADLHGKVLGKILAGFRQSGWDVVHVGTSDLALPIADGTGLVLKKFSGNSIRCGREWLLYHGTMLYGFDCSLAGRFLKQPPRQPDYRQGRPHGEFLINIPLLRETLIDLLRDVWQANQSCPALPTPAVQKLLAERYGRESWHSEL